MSEQESYKFPDELVVDPKDSSEDVKIEIVDDTPPQDRGREPMPKEIVKELEEDDLEEYSEKVKKRLGQMKKVWHDERREKERATREREEAAAFAARVLEENKQLKQRLGTGERVLISEVTKSATAELDLAKDNLRKALDESDAEKITAAQLAMTKAAMKLEKVSSFKPSLQTEEDDVKPVQQTQVSAQPVDRKAEAWRHRNEWFGTDDEMTAAALGLHQKLVRAHADDPDYARSDDYYRQIDATMRRRFPEYFGDSQFQTQETEAEKPTPRAKPANNVAPATRSTTPRRISLTPTQLALAKRLNLTPEAYAKELAKLENRNG